MLDLVLAGINYEISPEGNNRIMGTGKAEQQVFLEQIGNEDFLTPYRIACQYINQRLEEINTEYSKRLNRTFINQITYRIKTPQSCLDKMLKKKYTLDQTTAKERLGDIAGVRVVCNFLDDIYRLVDMIDKDKELEVIKIKDYVEKPKASGYQSLHVIVLVPAREEEKRKVEIQIRTQAMDLWAVVEHHFVYKRNGYEKCEFEKDLKECARAIYKIDKKMLFIREKMEKAQQ